MLDKKVSQMQDEREEQRPLNWSLRGARKQYVRKVSKVQQYMDVLVS